MKRKKQTSPVTRLLSSLEPGDRFRIPSLDKKGKLLYIAPGNARVRFDEDKVDVSITRSVPVIRLVKRKRGRKLT